MNGSWIVDHYEPLIIDVSLLTILFPFDLDDHALVMVGYIIIINSTKSIDVIQPQAMGDYSESSSFILHIVFFPWLVVLAIVSNTTINRQSL